MNKEPAGKCNADSEELAGRLACMTRQNVAPASELAERLTGMTRQNAAKTVHEWLKSIRLEPDEADIEAALRLRDIYDCHACVEHVAQVYVKGIMTARGGLFGMREELSEREAEEIAMRASEPAKRVRVFGMKTEAAGACTDNKCVETADVPRTDLADEPIPKRDDGKTQYDLIIDVRPPEEFAAGHREGAVNVPLAEYLEDPVAFATDRDAAILFVCSHGIKSRIAAEAAIRHGFWKVCYAGNNEVFTRE
jgi:rhodanese-related sulfurtransferase